MAASFSLPKGSVTDRTCMLNVLFKSFIGDIHMSWNAFSLLSDWSFPV